MKITNLIENDDDLFAQRTGGRYWNRDNPVLDNLWAQLVPASGGANTVEGELLRAANRLYYQYFNNGFMNNVSGAENFIRQYAPGSPVLKQALDTIHPYTRVDPYALDELENDPQQKMAVERSLDIIMDYVVQFILSQDGNYHPNDPQTNDLFAYDEPDDSDEDTWDEYAGDNTDDDEDDEYVDENTDDDELFADPGQTHGRVVAAINQFNNPLGDINITTDEYNEFLESLEEFGGRNWTEAEFESLVDPIYNRLDEPLARLLERVADGMVRLDEDRFWDELVRVLQNNYQRYGTEPRAALDGAIMAMERGLVAADRVPTRDDEDELSEDDDDLFADKTFKTLINEIAHALADAGAVSRYIVNPENVTDWLEANPSATNLLNHWLSLGENTQEDLVDEISNAMFEIDGGDDGYDLGYDLDEDQDDDDMFATSHLTTVRRAIAGMRRGGDISGTSLKGHVTTTYDHLERVFGKPMYGPDDTSGDGKVTCEWVITFGDGQVATIYDWKVYDATPREPYPWHIGGRGNDDVVEYIRIALGLGQDAISEDEDDELFSDPGRFGLRSRGKLIKFGANGVMILVAPDGEILVELPADRSQLDRLYQRAKAEAQSYLQAGYNPDDELTIDAIVDGNWEYPINLETWTLAELAALDEDQDDDELFAPRLKNNSRIKYYEEIYYSIEQLLLPIIPYGDPMYAVQPYLNENNISVDTMNLALQEIGNFRDVYQMYDHLLYQYEVENPDIDLNEYGMGSFQESQMKEIREFVEWTSEVIYEDSDKKKPTKTKTDQPKLDPNMFAPKQDQPLVPQEPTKSKSQQADQPRDIRRASTARTRQATAGITPTDQMRDMLGRLRNIEIDPDLPDYPSTEPETLPSVDVTTQNLPAVAGANMQAAGIQNPEFYQVAALPGNMAAAIRQLGKKLFGAMTATPTEDIYVVANLGGQGPNTTQEVNAVAGYLRDNGVNLGPGEIDFSKIMPGYTAETNQYTAGGIRWLLVRDFAGTYIYAWPEADSASLDREPKKLK